MLSTKSHAVNSDLTFTAIVALHRRLPLEQRADGLEIDLPCQGFIEVFFFIKFVFPDKLVFLSIDGKYDICLVIIISGI